MQIIGTHDEGKRCFPLEMWNGNFLQATDELQSPTREQRLVHHHRRLLWQVGTSWKEWLYYMKLCMRFIKKKMGGVILKLDFEKSYDKVN
jgi:hypothetical protein